MLETVTLLLWIGLFYCWGIQLLKERGERVGAEDGRGGNLSFSLCKFVLARTTRPQAKRQWTV